MRASHVAGVIAIAGLSLGGAVVAGSCHRGKSKVKFRTDTSQDLVADFSSGAGVVLVPDAPELRLAPHFIVRQEARKVLKLRQGMRAIFPARRIEEGSRIHFGAAVDPAVWSRPESATCLSIVLAPVPEGSGPDEEVFTIELRPAEHAGDRAWRDVEVDLSRFAGREAALEFRAAGAGSPDEPAVHAGFGNAILLSRGRTREEDDAWIVLDTPEVDLVRGRPPSIRLHGASWTDFYENFRTGEDAVDTGAGRPLLETPPGSFLEATLDLPRDATLEVEFGVLGAAGRLRRPDVPPPVDGEAEFRIVVDGHALLRERVSLAEARLERLRRRRVRLAEGTPGRATLRLETALIDGSAAYAPLFWTQATILREKLVARATAGEGRPNVLLVVVDTLRADHLGCYGYPRETSPSLDRLARGGRLFRRCTSASSWTVPSIASLLTGLPPLAHGALTYDRALLLDAFPRLPAWLQEHGVTTAAFVANPWIGRVGGFHRGFDEFQELIGLRAEDVNRAVENWLDQNAHLRFFAYLHYFDPHAPYGAPGPALNRFASDDRAERFGPGIDARVHAFDLALAEGRRLEIGDDELGYLRDLYDGEIRYFDDGFGALLDSMRARGLLERTLIVFTSDHGEAFLERGFLGHEFDVSEETVHVPLLFWYPPRIEAGLSDAAAATEDVLPTLAALLGLPLPADPRRRGRNLLARDASPERPVFTTTDQGIATLEGADSFRHRVRMSAIRRGSRKLVLVEGRAEHAYHDLAADPGERHNVAGSEPAAEASLRASLERWLEETRHAVRNRQFLSEEHRRHLEAFGYLTARPR